jgi:hypothetical protein
MANPNLNELLAEIVRTQATRRQPNFQQVSGLSQAILSGAGLQKPYESTNQLNQADPRGPSVVNRVLDIMSRPLYGAMNAIKGNLERTRGKTVEEGFLESAKMFAPITQPEIFKDIWAGVSGKEKTTGKDILSLGEDISGKELPGVAKAAAGFGLDVVADPLTYVGGLGLASKVGKGARTSTEALGAIEKGTGEAAQSLTEQISRQASKQAVDLAEEVPVQGLPAPLKGTPPRTFAAGPGLNKEVSNLTNLSKSGPLRAPEAAQDIGPIGRSGQPPLALTAAPEQAIRDPLEGLTEALTRSRAGRSELPNLISKLPEKADPMLALKVINERITSAKSPIVKNLLRKEAEKIQAGVKPADILSEARVTPPPFPELTIGPRWIETAQKAAQKFLGRNRLKNINHVGQTNLYNSILHAASKVRKDRRQFHVLQMLRIAEEEVLKSGRHLTDAEGLSVRLSDIANLSGGPRSLSSKLVDDFRKARPSQQVEDLKSFTTPQVASEVLDPVISAGAKIAEVAKELPPSQTVMIGSQISRELMKLAEKAGASTREAKTAKAFIDDLFSPVRDKLYTGIEQEARNLVRQSSTGIVNPETLHKISKAMYDSLGANPKILGRQLNQTKVVEGIMTKFATWWGAKDLKPFSREYIDTARNVAGAFAETMTPLVRATKPSQRQAAFAVSQGKRAASSPQEQQLADQFKYLVEKLMGTHGITSNSEAVVLRSGTVLKELNDELPKVLQFVEKKGSDDIGRAFDYTDGNWMHSWKEWDVKEPAEALYQLTRAMQMVTRKNSMWDDAAIRWGMPVKGAEFQHQAQNVERLKGTYFPQQIADQLNNLQRQLDRDVFKTPHKALEYFDKIQRMWKTGVTIYSPSHHIRNLNGDIYLAALDGVVSPKPYAIATRVLHAYPTRYKDLESVFNIMDPKLRDSALRARPGNVVVTTRRGDKLTSEQIYQAAESQGLFIRGVDIEDLVGNQNPAMGTFGGKIQPFGGRLHDVATRTSELRDHWVRLAHFVDVLSKSNAPLKTAIEQAGRRVKKSHPDGMDLTGFEQNVMRRLIPFYSWMRKATPLVVEGAIMRPHITMAFPKAMANMQSITGIESEGPGDPFPMDQMFPDWIKEKGIGPVLQPGSGLGRDETWRGEAPGYTIVNPTNPFIDQIAQIGSPGKTAMSSLTPGLRIPLELLQGQSSLGIPLESMEGGTPGYLAQQIPAVGIGARVTGLTRDNEPYNPEQLLNWLTSAGITGTGPYQAQSQTEIRQLLTEMAKKNRGDYR